MFIIFFLEDQFWWILFTVNSIGLIATSLCVQCVSFLPYHGCFFIDHLVFKTCHIGLFLCEQSWFWEKMHLFMYFKDRTTERRREREIFYLLVLLARTASYASITGIGLTPCITILGPKDYCFNCNVLTGHLVTH